MYHTFLTLCLTSFVIAHNNLISPCPRSFVYETDRKEPNKWYGILTMLSDFDTHGVYVHISLSKPPLQFGNWYGEVLTENNQEFIIVNTKHGLKANVPKMIRFFVKFNTSEPPPVIEWIVANSKKVCPDTEIMETTTRVQLDFKPKPSPVEATSNKPAKGFIGKTPTTLKNDKFHKEDSNLLTTLLKNEKIAGSPIETISYKPISEAPTSPKNEKSYQDDLKLLATLLSSNKELNVLTPSIKNETLVEPSPVETTSSKPSGGVISQPPYTSSELGKETGDSTNDDICGTVAVPPAPLIIYGQPTYEGEFPWHVAIYYSGGIDFTYICGASLVSQDFVITVAHCVTMPRSSNPLDPDNLSVYLGKHYLKHNTNPGIQVRQISEIIIHANYNPQMYSDDIALLQLELQAEYTDYVRPICLWQDSPNLDSIVKKQGKVIGWGYDETGIVTDRLMKTEMPVVSQDTCLLSNTEFYSRYTSESTLCAGFRNGTTICHGDSGGGMVFPKSKSSPENPVWQLRGLISISAPSNSKFKCDASNYVVFTDAAKYVDWIQNKIK